MAYTTSDLDRAEALFNERTKGLAGIPVAGTSINKGRWSDFHLEEIIEKIPVKKYTDEEASLAISRFFEYYITGVIRKGDNTSAIIVDAILSCRTLSDWLIARNDKGSDWFFRNGSEEDFNTEDRLNCALEVQVPQIVKDSNEMDAYKELLCTFTQNDAVEFATWIKGAVKTTSNMFPIARLLAAYLAMTSLRAASKDSVSLHNAYSKKQYRKNMSALINYDAGWPFAPPSKGYIDAVVATFGNADHVTRTLFALLTNTYIRADDRHDSVNVEAILGASVMLHTSRTGLGLIQLLANAAKALGCTWQDIGKKTIFPSTMGAWTNITHFMADTVGGPEAQLSWPWSRLINDSYNKELAPKDCIPLAVMLAEAGSAICGKGIWKAKWSERLSQEELRWRAVGSVLREELTPSVARLVTSSSNKEFGEKVQAYLEKNPLYHLTGTAYADVEVEESDEGESDGSEDSQGPPAPPLGGHHISAPEADDFSAADLY